jgi:hypothetical protein
MEVSKILFSPAESKLMNDASVILTKNTVLQKVKDIFIGLQSGMQDELVSHTSNTVFAIPPKISKGENYLGLPYLILDYPRSFREGNILAIRSMFWWGHYFSSTLHLSGIHRERVQERIESSYDRFAGEGYFIAIHEDQWLHQFEKDVYLPVSGLSKDDFIKYCRQFDHLKIGITWPLRDGSDAASSLMKSWKFLVKAGVA